MDDPSATISSSGNIYLRVKFKIESLDGVDYFVIDPTYDPIIGLFPPEDPVEYEYSYSAGVSTIDPLKSFATWKIASANESTMRYFHGYKKQFDEVDFEAGPVYKKGAVYPNEWGVATLELIETGDIRLNDVGSPFSYEAGAGWLASLTYDSPWQYGKDAYGSILSSVLVKRLIP